METVCEEGFDCAGTRCVAACDGPVCDGACCGEAQLCLAGACVEPGPACTSDAGCAPEERCDPVGLRCIPTPSVGCMAPRPFEPEVQWENTAIHSSSVPLVVQLTDDDGDGRIGPGDVPDVVIVTAPPPSDEVVGRILAFSGDDGRALWEVGNLFFGICSHASAAAGDFDGDGTIEIAVAARIIEPHVHDTIDPDDPIPCTTPPRPPTSCGPFPPDRGPPHTHSPSMDPRVDHMHQDTLCTTFHDRPGSLVILSHEGEVERVVALPLLEREELTETLTVADLDGDGRAEVIASGAVIGADGVLWADARIAAVGLAVGDLDLDGRMEIATARHVFEHDGTLRWSNPEAPGDGHPAIGRVSRRPMSSGPEVIVVDGEDLVVRDGATGEAVLGPLRFAAGGVSSGPPTLADFDGDGEIEIGIAADHAYVVIDPDLTTPSLTRWSATSADHTPGTVGASAFDFDGDGAADVAYADECHVRILSGRSGETLWAHSNPSITTWEYPVVADVDLDGHAELVVVSNMEFGDQPRRRGCDRRADPYTEVSAGVRVFRDRLDNWAATRPLWNQHGYHIDNIGDDGSIPAAPPRPWESHNTWRASLRPPTEGDAPLPDLVIGALRVTGATCGLSPVSLSARLENRGERGVEPGVSVTFWDGPRALGTARSTRTLLPGAAEWLSVPADRDAASSLSLRATADDEDVVSECDEDNGSDELAVTCAEP